MAQLDNPLVSIVIVCMNRLDNLYPCLESIRKWTGVPYETLVTAYLFDPQNLERVRKDFPEVKFIPSDEIRGFSENNNLALRQARGRYIFILNDDTLMIEDVVGRLCADFALLPDNAAILTPRLLNEDGSLQLCGRPPYPAGNYLLQQWHLFSEGKDDTVGKTPVVGSIFATSNISGAAFLIKADIFRELGWLDERYFFTPEDIALSTLARKRGYGVYVDRDASIIHKWRTTASSMSVAVRPAAVRGSLIFFSEGKPLRYLFLAAGIWHAESAKRIKAALRYMVSRDPKVLLSLRTYRAICRAIFTRRSPKEIFIREYEKLRRK